MLRFIKIVLFLAFFAAGLGFYIHKSNGYLHSRYDADLMKLVDWANSYITPGLSYGKNWGLGGKIGG